jgi:dCTP deaminase
MSFWSNQTLLKRIPAEEIVTDFNAECVKYCAYELKLGGEAFLTSSTDGTKQDIDSNGQIVIPPGQLALLISKEAVKVPAKVIGFISFKASDKFRGLVNISGFHVDPGFKGKLKFSVYNAGGQNIVLTRDSPVFLIFFADLDVAAEPAYAGQHQDQKAITSKDVMQMQGKLASPAVLDDRMKKLENLVEIWTRVIQALGVGALLLVAGVCAKSCGLLETASLKGAAQTNSALASTVTPQQATSASLAQTASSAPTNLVPQTVIETNHNSSEVRTTSTIKTN